MKAHVNFSRVTRYMIGVVTASLPSSNASHQVRADLLPGEHLLWEGHPDPRLLFTPADAFIVPFSILWCGFAIFWVVGASRTAGLGFASFGLLFVLVGLYLVFGRFIYKTNRKRRTAYAISDRRVIVATGSNSISQMPVRDQPTTVRRRKEHVSVVIGTAPRLQQSAYANTGLDFWSRDAGNVGLWDVADGDNLLKALRSAQSA